MVKLCMKRLWFCGIITATFHANTLGDKSAISSTFRIVKGVFQKSVSENPLSDAIIMADWKPRLLAIQQHRGKASCFQ